MSDRGYVNLLNYLHRSSTSLSIQTIQASIAYYLVHVQPSSTPLAATVVGSSLFRPFSDEKLEAACTAFRHAVHIKVKVLEDEEKTAGSIFLRSLEARIGDWVNAILKGVQGGQAMMRMACYSGLLMGLEDFEKTLKMRQGYPRGRLENEVVLALAEVLDLYSSVADWETEFHCDTEGGVNALSLAFIIASRSLPLVSADKLSSLPLHIFLPSLSSTIASAFQGGRFAQHLRTSPVATKDVNNHPLAASLTSLSSSPIYVNMGALARLYTSSVSVAVDSRNKQLWPIMSNMLLQLEDMATKIEADWENNPLVDTTNEKDMVPSMRDLMSTLWNALKTFLFTTVMITQSIAIAMTYLPPPSDSIPPSLALTILHTLSRLSFVISQFGGVTSTSQGGFSELKRVFYSALDVLSTDPVVSEKFVLELCSRVSMRSQVMENNKKAFALACVEQLVPTLSDSVIENAVFPLSLPYLSDPTNRETYESAHSVLLAIFALHSQRVGDDAGTVEKDEGLKRPFAEKIVPFYMNCLLDNSQDGKLATGQLRLAFATLVQSAGSNGSELGDALAWFCIESLLDAIKSAGTSSSKRHHKSRTRNDHHRVESATDREQMHKLHLTLISTIPSLPLKLLPRVLEEIEDVIIHESDKEKKKELVDVALTEILEKVGDREKVVVLKWWLDHQEEFGKDIVVDHDSVGIVSKL